MNVRVIILNYKSSKYTLNTVNAVLLQTYPFIEIIVVDNSCDHLEASYLAKNLPKSVYLIVSPENLGYSAGNNLGLKFNSGIVVDYFIIFNNDLNIEDKNIVTELVKEMVAQSDNKVVAMSPLIDTSHSLTPVEFQIQVRKILGKYELLILSFFPFKKILINKYNKFIYKYDQPYADKLIYTDTINGSAFIINGQFIKDNNYLDENVFLFHEEMILGKQIMNSGYKCMLNGKLKIFHIQGISTNSNANAYNMQMERYKYKSEAYFFEKYLHINFILIQIYIIFKKIEIYIKYIKYRIIYKY